jgi:dephospho-CoA kinase
LKKWANKYIIGLTGSIGTGKSVVRRMLEQLGAYGIDADALGHRAMAKGAPGYDPVLETFGRFLLTPDEQIDRSRLGRMVFSDPEALTVLEGIIHPLVVQAVDLLVRRAPQKVVVIEAIKLLETNLADMCDSIWVTYTPPEIQLQRLMQNRNMTEKDARQRIASQIPQESRFSRATVIIKNVSTFHQTWRQVTTEWQRHVPTKPVGEFPISEPVKLPLGEVNVQRAGPKNTTEIARLFNELAKQEVSVKPSDIMEAFGEKAFLLLRVENNIMGVLAWQVENLVSRTTEILMDQALAPAQYLPILIREMEHASSQLQSEVSLIFVPPHLSRHESLWTSLGYVEKKPGELNVLAWREAAEDSMPADSVLFFKQLRPDRVLKPI